MIDPNHVIVRCPRGHELQAAREHLSAKLSCPVCGVEFVPASVGAPAAPPQGAVPLTYAGHMVSNEPIEYPGVTTAMIWLFLIAAIANIGTNVLAYIYHEDMIAAQTSPTPQIGPMMTLFAPACISLLCWVIGIVLHLIWIHRIHKDASRAGGYSRISPAAALGVSFIPWFNYIWTGMTMKKLARFATERSGDADPRQTPKCREAESFAGMTLVAGLILAVVNLGIYAVSTAVGATSALAAMRSGGNVDPDTFAEQANMIPPWVGAAAAVVGLFCTIIYFIAVPRLEAALYPALGAPPK